MDTGHNRGNVLDTHLAIFGSMYKAIASSGILEEDCGSHQQYPKVVVNSAEKEELDEEGQWYASTRKTENQACSRKS